MTNMGKAQHTRQNDFRPIDITDGLSARPDLQFSQSELEAFAKANGGKGESFSDTETTGRNAARCAITQFSSAKPVKEGDEQYRMKMLDVFILPFKPIYQEYVDALEAHKKDPKHHPKPVYDRRLYEYDIDSEALAVTGTRFERAEGENGPITGMWLEPRDPETGAILKSTRIENPCDSFAQAYAHISDFIVQAHDLYYNAPFDKRFLRAKTLDATAYAMFREKRDAGEYHDIVTDHDKAAKIADIREALERSTPTIFDPSPRDWQCLLHAYTANYPGRGRNKLDDAYRELVDTGFSERKEHDAAEDIAMSAKLAATLHKTLDDIPDFTAIWHRLVSQQVPQASAQADDYHVAPFETRKHLYEHPQAETIKAVRIHLPDDEDSAALHGFFTDMYALQERSGSPRHAILDIQESDGGSDIWLNPAERDGKPMLASLIKRFTTFTHVLDSKKIESIHWHDSASLCDVKLCHSDEILQNVPLQSLLLNLDFIKAANYSDDDLFDLLKFIRRLGTHPKLGAVQFYDDEGTLCAKLKGKAIDSGEFIFRMPEETNPLNKYASIVEYLEDLSAVGLLSGIDEAAYELSDAPEDDDAFEQEMQRLRNERDQTFTLEMPPDKQGPFSLGVSPAVSKLLKYQLGDAPRGCTLDDATGKVTFNGLLSDVRMQQDNERTLQRALGDAAWLYYRLKAVPDVDDVRVEEEQVTLVSHNGISERSLMALYRAGVAFQITPKANETAAEITLKYNDLFQDAFNISKALKEATSDINIFYTGDEPAPAAGAKSMSTVREKWEFLNRQQPNMQYLASELNAGKLKHLRMNAARSLYCATHADAVEHQMIAPTESEAVHIAQDEDQRLQALTSSLQTPNVRVMLSQQEARFQFKGSSPLPYWFKQWLKARQVPLASCTQKEITLQQPEDYLKALAGLSALTKHYYQLHRHVGSLPIVQDAKEPEPLMREIALEKVGFPHAAEMKTLQEHVRGLLNRLIDLDGALKTELAEATHSEGVVDELLAKALWQNSQMTFPVKPTQRRSANATHLREVLAPTEQLRDAYGFLSRYSDTQTGYPHAIEKQYGLYIDSPRPSKSALRSEIEWLEQLQYAAKQCNASKSEQAAISALMTRLNLVDNAVQRTYEASTEIHRYITQPTHGLAVLYGKLLLMQLPEDVATLAMEGNAKAVDAATENIRSFTRATRGENKAASLMNEAVAQHLLYYASPKGQTQWHAKQPDIPIELVLQALLEHACSPALKPKDAAHLSQLITCSNTMEAFNKAARNFWAHADEHALDALEKTRYKGRIMDALALAKGVVAPEQLAASHIAMQTFETDTKTQKKEALREAKNACGFLVSALKQFDEDAINPRECSPQEQEDAQRYIRTVSDQLPDAYREDKLVKALIRKHGNAHEGFIKSWSDFQKTSDYAQKFLAQTAALLADYDQVAEPLALLEARIHNEYAQSIRRQLDEQALSYEETEESTAWQVDLSPLLTGRTAAKPTSQTPEQQAPPELFAEPTGWEPGWQEHLAAQHLLEDVPESLQGALKPLADSLTAFRDHGFLPEIILSVKGANADEKAVLKAVNGMFGAVFPALVAADDASWQPHVSFDEETGELRVHVEQVHERSPQLLTQALADARNYQRVLQPPTRTTNKNAQAESQQWDTWLDRLEQDQPQAPVRRA